MTLDEQIAVIEQLPKAEQDGLGMVCTGQDQEVPQNILKELVKKRLVLKRTNGRYDVVSYWLHYAWCEWCSRQTTGPAHE